MINYNIKELVAIMGYDDWPIHFEKITEKTLEIFYFKPISDREYRDVIEMGRYENFVDYKYYKNQIGAYMPDATVLEVIEFDKKRCEIRTELFWEFISNRFDVKKYDKEVVYCVFSILHEIGHWYNYIILQLTPTDYVRAEAEEKFIDEKMHKRIKMEEDVLLQKKLIEEEFAFYRTMKNEKAADEFAFKHIEESLRKIYEG